MLSEESPLCDPALYDRPLCLLSARHIFSTAHGRVGKEESERKNKYRTERIISLGGGVTTAVTYAQKPPPNPGGVAAAAKQVVALRAPALDGGGGRDCGGPPRALVAETRWPSAGRHTRPPPIAATVSRRRPYRSVRKRFARPCARVSVFIFSRVRVCILCASVVLRVCDFFRFYRRAPYTSVDTPKCKIIYYFYNFNFFFFFWEN